MPAPISPTGTTPPLTPPIPPGSDTAVTGAGATGATATSGGVTGGGVTGGGITTGSTTGTSATSAPTAGVLKTGIASLTVDGVDIAYGTLGVRAVKPVGASEEVAGILSQFPLNDLSQITTDGRYAQGFRLDSGSLRLMWMSVRRTTESDGTQGFEIFFQAHGAAVERYKKRMEEQGAKSGSFQFFAADPDPASDPGKSALKRNGQKWNPSGSALTLAQDGKWSVDFVSESPEAIKGAMRLRVFGNDADATKALNEVIGKLGLQTAFAPPTPKALEKLKIMRLLWQISPGAADRLRFKPREDLTAHADLANFAKDADPTAVAAIDGADLASASVSKRVRLAALLYETKPRAFLDWAKSDSASVSGILPSGSASDPDSALNTALTNAGVPTNGEAYKAALETPVDEAGARQLLRLGLLAKKALSKAEDVAGRDVEGIKLTELQDLCAELGVSTERIANLKFDEVYPGYFTVVDPQLSEDLHKVGARYLYSTADNPDRVHQMLTGGQKASLTRFQEGLLIQGKSSSRDFETGGASSVFSRLVTDSVIQKVKKGETGYETTFYDWSGSRPYKLIINRRILDRTDWYGFNGDNFGRTTNLKPENHGEAVVKTINAAFSRSNELCFPIGNDPAYVDYVACGTDQQKKDLIAHLTSKGITEWHGKPLDDFIIVPVGNKLPEHPDDITLLSSIRDALMLDGLKDAVKAAADPIKAAVEAKVAEGAPAVAKALAEEQAQSTGRTSLESNLSSTARTAASTAVTAATELVKALDVDVTKEKVRTIAIDAAKASAKTGLEDLSRYSTWSIDSPIRTAAEANAQKAAEAFVGPLLEKMIADAEIPADTTPESKKAVRDKLDAELRAAVRAHLIELAKTDGAAAATTKCESVVLDSGVSNVRSAAQTAARDAVGDAAVAATNPEALAALLAEVQTATKAKLEETALKTLQDRGPGWIKSNLRTQVETKTTELAMEAAAPAAIPVVLAEGKAKAEEAAKTARDTYAGKFPAKVTPEDEAQIPALVESVIGDLATTAANASAKSMVSSLATKYTDEAATAAFAALGPDIAAQAVTALTAQVSQSAAEQPIRTAATAVANEVYQDAVKAVAEELKQSVGAKLAEAALERVSQAIGDKWATWAVNNKLGAAVDAVMAKVPPPPPADTTPPPTTTG